jgi:hypothetical protein
MNVGEIVDLGFGPVKREARILKQARDFEGSLFWEVEELNNPTRHHAIYVAEDGSWQIKRLNMTVPETKPDDGKIILNPVPGIIRTSR